LPAKGLSTINGTFFVVSKT